MMKILPNFTKKSIKATRPLGLLLLGLCLFVSQAQAQVTSFPYFSDFESDDGGWTIGGTLWELGTPANAVIIGASSGVNAWVTDLDANYPTSVFETLVSPVFDFSGFTDDPTITMDIWWQSEFSWDGAVLESSIDAGATWQQVGAFGDPDNWYTDNTINGLPTGTQEGWTGRNGDGTGAADGSLGYVEASHLLDGLAGQAAVQLRVAFGSDGSVTDDGFAFDNVFVGTPPPPPITDFPYQESFEEGDGGWIPGGAVWELGTPANDVIIGASDGDNAWITDLDDNYPTSFEEAVVSPTFDFTSFTDDPIITMDIWWQSEFSWDGAVLQSSIDAGATWVQVGAFGDPDNWYTDNSINGLSTDTQEGWTGRESSSNGSGGYVEAAHALDGLAGQAAVQLRILFGSDGSVTDNGFAFDNVRIGDGAVAAEIMCPEDIEVNLSVSGNGDCTATVDYDMPVVTGTMNTATQTAGLASGEDFPLGTTTNTFEVMDDEGNILSCSFDVTVVDDVDPTIECPEDILINAETGEVTVTIPDFTGDAVAADNCPDPTVTQDPVAGTVVDAGIVVDVTLTVTDAAGNEATCDFVVTTDFSLSTDDFTLENSISIYPNPTTGIINLTNRNNIALTDAVVTDINGRVIQTIRLGDANATTQISLETLSNGLYFVRINSENASVVRRVIKN